MRFFLVTAALNCVTCVVNQLMYRRGQLARAAVGQTGIHQVRFLPSPTRAFALPSRDAFVSHVLQKHPMAGLKDYLPDLDRPTTMIRPPNELTQTEIFTRQQEIEFEEMKFRQALHTQGLTSRVRQLLDRFLIELKSRLHNFRERNE